MNRQILVPGNLLLLGEYAVTLQGGLGIAAAIDRYVKIMVMPSKALEIHSNYGGRRNLWKPGMQHPLFEIALRSTKQYLTAKKSIVPDWKLNIHIDSSEFYFSDGRKKGFGSSAAVAVGLTYALLWGALTREPRKSEELFPLALDIHRTFQGGKGSGYDIAASTHGGVSLVTGGDLPHNELLALPWLRHVELLYGDAPVSTVQAVSRYNALCAQKPEKFSTYLQTSNALVQQFATTKTIADARSILLKALALNEDIHRELGMAPSGASLKKAIARYALRNIAAKPVGAGYELAVAFPFDNTHLGKDDEETAGIANEGIRCMP